jgi:hypothetical protein
MNKEERPMTDELAALLGDLVTVLDDLVLAVRDVKANVCEALEALRHKVARRLYELADRLLVTEERKTMARNFPRGTQPARAVVWEAHP